MVAQRIRSESKACDIKNEEADGEQEE